MGDSAELRSLDFRVKGYNFVGDLQRFTGSVIEKSRAENGCFVRCRLESSNQMGETTGDGYALVSLPSRGVARDQRAGS
jgi:hypothetical protein